jgi:18S rRNA (guanine1575-N7)-methyltransferase
MSRRPEHENPPEVYYNDTVARRYDQSSRIRNIQRKMSERAVELLQLPKDEPCHILDLGCGSGLSGEVLESFGHSWVGMDISLGMLKIAKATEFESDDDSDGENIVGNGNRRPSPFGQLPLEQESDDDEEDEEDDDDAPSGRKFREVLAADMGLGVPFRPGVFDGVISISAIQWLCYMDKKTNIPQKRLKTLFQSLYNSLRRGARAVLQFYPESATQMNMISQAAMKCGFGGGMVVDYPHSTKAKKYFLVLYAGQPGGNYRPPQPLLGEPADYDDVDVDEVDDDEEGEDEDVDEELEEDDATMDENGKRIRTCARSRPQYGKPQTKRRRKDNRPVTGTRDWVLLKKDERRTFGLKTTADSKYTMRRRKPRF